MNQQHENPEQTAQRQLQIIKASLDAAVKGSVFSNMDETFAVAEAFNGIAQLVKIGIESKKNEGTGTE
jgi:hypothetical protein